VLRTRALLNDALAEANQVGTDAHSAARHVGQRHHLVVRQRGLAGDEAGAGQVLHVQPCAGRPSAGSQAHVYTHERQRRRTVLAADDVGEHVPHLLGRLCCATDGSRRVFVARNRGRCSPSLSPFAFSLALSLRSALSPALSPATLSVSFLLSAASSAGGVGSGSSGLTSTRWHTTLSRSSARGCG
jgi:hypothetical protein